MTTRTVETSLLSRARVAGFLYLIGKNAPWQLPDRTIGV